MIWIKAKEKDLEFKPPRGLLDPEYALRGRGAHQADPHQPAEQRGQIHPGGVCQAFGPVRAPVAEPGAGLVLGGGHRTGGQKGEYPLYFQLAKLSIHTE